MKVLILGGCGFIGDAIAHALNEHTVTRVDKTGGDVCFDVLADPEQLDRLVAQHDWVVHLLGGGGTKYFFTNEHATGDSLRITDAIAQSCAKHAKPLMFTSTIAVYTSFTPRPAPFSEHMRAVPDEIYGAVKLLSEQIIKDSGAPYVIFRLSNVYGFGPNFQSSGVLGLFVRLAGEAKPLTVIGTNALDYVHREDVGRAFALAIAKNVRNEIVNIGSGIAITPMQIAQNVASAFSVSGKLVAIEQKATTGTQYADRWLDTAKAKRVLGWEPTISFHSGVERTVSEFLKR